MDYSLFQDHTVNLYRLTEKRFTIKHITARSLLSPLRFDLFAKLFYARNRNVLPLQAQKVYMEHIKAFNPDGHEPGRDDKSSFEDFLSSFNNLLDYFRDNDFDDSISIVPVAENGIILDGAHRIAALAFYNKKVTVALFEDVLPVSQFDYSYFKKRGLSQDICDIIAKEVLNWIPNCFVACLWPKMGNDTQKQIALEHLKSDGVVFYSKKIHVSLSAFGTFIAKVYQMQPWVGNKQNGFAGAKDKALNCYGKNKNVDFIFFCFNKSLHELLAIKGAIRGLYPYQKHSLHITDCDEETKDVAYYVLSKDGLEEWLYTKDTAGYLTRFRESLQERMYIFRNVQWIQFKSLVYSCMFKK